MKTYVSVQSIAVLRRPRWSLFAGQLRSSCWFIGLASVMLGSQLQATTLLKLDLGGLCKRAHQIVRGEVLDISLGTVELGGGQVPTVTYKIKIAETIYGAPVGVQSITMIGNVKGEPTVGNARRVGVLSDLPQLEKGRSYLLFTTKPSKVGLSTTVGLGQGCFQIKTQGKSDLAVNSLNNSGLGLGSDGPVEYKALVAEILKRLGK